MAPPILIRPIAKPLSTRLGLTAAALAGLTLLSGCKAVVLAPAGDIAVQQRDLLLVSTGLMLLIIIPVIALVALFAWKYRHSNTEAEYEPDWDHSTYLEVAIWGAPLLIVICLGAITWAGTHLLDPYRPLDRIAAGRAAPANVRPLQVEVVALDWKWLFIYPEYGIATVNELAAPVDRPIQFTITASSVMNSFYIPALAGQIYAMPGMQTTLHGVINTPGEYKGFSANYSGAGFSGMHFVFHGMTQTGFDQWVSQVRTSGQPLDRAGYLKLETPSENVPVRHYGGVDSRLFDDIVNLCVRPGQACGNHMPHGAPPVTDTRAPAGDAPTAGVPTGTGHDPRQTHKILPDPSLPDPAPHHGAHAPS